MTIQMIFVGDQVAFHYGVNAVTAIVREDRGNIGAGGRRLLRVELVPVVEGVPQEQEVPAEECAVLNRKTFKKGDKVRIKRGTPVHTLTKGTANAKRSYTITVDHMLEGWRDGEVWHAPKVRWAGSGGYWSDADAHLVEKI